MKFVLLSSQELVFPILTDTDKQNSRTYYTINYLATALQALFTSQSDNINPL